MRLPAAPGSRDERGMSMITTFVIIFMLLALSTLIAIQATHSNQQTGMDRSRTQAFHVAEAGIARAISRLAADPNFTGESSTPNPTVYAGQSPGGTPFSVGTYSTVVSTVSGVPNDRMITATALAGGQTRIIKQQVHLMPTGEFSYALFSATNMSMDNNMTVTGDTYSTQATVLQNHTVTMGDVVSPSDITTSNNSTISGTVWSGGNVVISTGTTVNGNVLATGSVTVHGTVTGDVRAASVTADPGSIKGQVVLTSQVQPATRTLPTFTYNPANYPDLVQPAPMTSAAFQTYWATHLNAMAGTFYIADGGTVIGPNQSTTLTGNLTIITNGVIQMQRDVSLSGGGPYRLVMVSTCSACSPAIWWTNNVTMPPGVQTFIYSTGQVRFYNQKNFHGIVYANQITQDQNFTVTYEQALASNPPPGFTWDLSSSGVWDVQPGFWKECNQAAGC